MGLWVECSTYKRVAPSPVKHMRMEQYLGWEFSENENHCWWHILDYPFCFLLGSGGQSGISRVLQFTYKLCSQALLPMTSTVAHSWLNCHGWQDHVNQYLSPWTNILNIFWCLQQSNIAKRLAAPITSVAYGCSRGGRFRLIDSCDYNITSVPLVHAEHSLQACVAWQQINVQDCTKGWPLLLVTSIAFIPSQCVSASLVLGLSFCITSISPPTNDSYDNYLLAHNILFCVFLDTSSSVQSSKRWMWLFVLVSWWHCNWQLACCENLSGK